MNKHRKSHDRVNPRVEASIIGEYGDLLSLSIKIKTLFLLKLFLIICKNNLTIKPTS
jgi:hypothetical protein